MFDKYMIVEEVFKNVKKDGKITGYQVGVRLPYYRGVVLSLVGSIKLTVDNEVISAEHMYLTIAKKTLPLKNITEEPELKWEFGEVGIVTVSKPGGLELGMHVIDLQIHMDISYVPGGFDGHDSKELQLTD